MDKVLCIKCGKEFDLDISNEKGYMIEIYSKYGCPHCTEMEDIIMRCFNEEVYIRIDSQEQWKRFMDKYKETLRWDTREFRITDYKSVHGEFVKLEDMSIIFFHEMGANGFWYHRVNKEEKEKGIYDGRILVDWEG